MLKGEICGGGGGGISGTLLVGKNASLCSNNFTLKGKSRGKRVDGGRGVLRGKGDNFFKL